MHERTRAVLTKLRGEKSPVRDEGISAFVDFLLDRPLEELVDVEGIADLVIEASSEEHGRRILERHVRPAYHRQRELSREAEETLGDLLHQDGREEIVAILERLKSPKIEGVGSEIDPVLLKRLLAPVLQETLLSFTSRLPIPGVGGGGKGEGGLGGLAGRLSKGVGERAGRWADVGKSMLGDLDKRVQAAARDFSEGALTQMRRSLAERLKSDEGRDLVAQIRNRAVETALSIEVAALLDELDRQPREAIDELLLRAVAHNMRRERIKDAVRMEVEALVTVEGKRSVRNLLEEAGILDRVRAFLIEKGNPVARAWIESEAFSEYLDRLLAD